MREIKNCPLVTPLITGIGSLPHHNVDAALEYSFKHSLPFLPQIPMANPWEFMLSQALDGLPGLVADREGGVTLDLDVWNGRRRVFDEKLLNAFSTMSRADAFEALEPTTSSSSCWQPFLWELEERNIKTAKVQITGPITAQMALRLKDGTSPWKVPELASQVYRLILARALAMTRRLQALQIQPVLFLDEPAFYALDLSNPAHKLTFQELKLLITALQKENVIVGVHCCSNTNWSSVSELGADYLSIDCHLSLEAVLATHKIKSGFSFGIIPTGKTTIELLRSLKTEGLVSNLKNQLDMNSLPSAKILKSSLYTPACGLAFQTVESSEIVLSLLQEVVSKLD